LKIPQKAFHDGRPMDRGDTGGVLFQAYNANQKSDILQTVLSVHDAQMFTRLKAWADRQLDARGLETWVISHRCHQGHLRCGTPAHLFLATNSINQRQRQCPVSSTAICTNCHELPV